MKYLPLRDFDNVTSALNFETADCHVVGSCDLYTTKAAGSDKKLYKTIDRSLESQYESALRFSASLSPPQATMAAASLNLSRSSPFGPLTQISSRRTFAYLIATLNASHPDYDFSHLLRPSDFRREKSLKAVMNTLDTTLYNLRPKPASLSTGYPSQWSSEVMSPEQPIPIGTQSWGPRMWRLVDKEMNLKECSVYCFSPDEDPCDGEEGAIWSFNYFFFNKAKKRVCYIYLRGLSIISHSPEQRTPMTPIATPIAKRTADGEWSRKESGAGKRARYWLGDRAMGNVSRDTGDDDEEEDLIEDFGNNEAEFIDLIDDDDSTKYLSSADESVGSPRRRSRSKSASRANSDEIAGSMEV